MIPAASGAPAPSACDNEPIHMLGGIQPFGFLISANATWTVNRASENIEGLLGIPHADVLGRPVAGLLPERLLHDIRGRLQLAGGFGIVERLFDQRPIENGPAFDIAVHRSGRDFVLEFEPASGESGAALATLRGMLARVERHRSEYALYKEAARQVSALTGFARVMIYRFDSDGAGEVIAEHARHGLSPYLGLHYPASDIPAQARALYERNFLRIIKDVDAEAIPVAPVQSPQGDKLDLSMSVLRSVSPVHIEYLKGMGVRSSMSISILRDGRLWGLIACHHDTPLQIGLEIRSTAELFGQMFSYLLETRRREEDTRYDIRVRDVHNGVAIAFAEPTMPLGEIPKFLTGITDYIACDGIGIFHDGQVTLSGLTPNREEFLLLLNFLSAKTSGRIFSTHKLSEIFPPAAEFTPRACGLLSIPISRSARDYLIFFRRETAKTLAWAGKPTKAESPGADGPRLSPRKSFAAWRETVRGQSAHWDERELRAAADLRVTLVELVLRLSDAAQSGQAVAQRRQELVIAELNHRVRNILGLVRGLIIQSSASAKDMRSFVESLEERVRSLARAHDLMSSGQGKRVSLHALLQAEIEVYNPEGDATVLIGPDVMLENQTLSAMALVMHELVTNARKYGALKIPGGRIAVRTSVDPAGDVAVSWRESGGPPVLPPLRRGFGSTILEQVIPFELNGASNARYLPTGFAFDLVLPASLVEVEAKPAGNVHPARRNAATDAPAADTASLEALLAETLLVEDNLFIALDAEDLLRGLGAASVEVARSAQDAVAAMTRKRFTFALLDVNLGAETSMPVARLLQASQIPFAFGTGYGDALALPDGLVGAAVVSKPYHRMAILRALEPFLARPVVPGAATTATSAASPPSQIDTLDLTPAR